MDSYILTSTYPSLDAVLACWLLQRYGEFLNTDIRFEHPDNPHPEILEQATVVCDVGNNYDAQNLRFSHHHDLNLPGAGKLVYQYLLEQSDTLRHFEPIVELIDAEHTAKPHVFIEASRLCGLHALYQALSITAKTDRERLHWGYYLLDGIDRVIQINTEIRNLVEKQTVYRSDDGAVVALMNVPQECHRVAFEDGATLVLFCNLDDRAIGCIRKNDNDRAIPHVGNLIADVIAVLQNEYQTEPTVSEYIDELRTWFCHPAGTYAARGTNGFPSQNPIKVDIRIIAKFVDTVWNR